jgi:hypothetical protein
VTLVAPLLLLELMAIHIAHGATTTPITSGATITSITPRGNTTLLLMELLPPLLLLVLLLPLLLLELLPPLLLLELLPPLLLLERNRIGKEVIGERTVVTILRSTVKERVGCLRTSKAQENF